MKELPILFYFIFFTELNSVVQLSLNYLNLHVRSFGWHKFGNLCCTQCISSVYPPVRLWLILYPLTLWDREGLCLGGNTAPAT